MKDYYQVVLLRIYHPLFVARRRFPKLGTNRVASNVSYLTLLMHNIAVHNAAIGSFVGRWL
jgi:hypothetical protein